MISATPAAFLGLGIGPSEALLCLAIFLIFLGPRELPRIARTLGKMAGHLRKASDEFRDQVMNLDRQENPSTEKPPIPNPGPVNEEKTDEHAG